MTDALTNAFASWVGRGFRYKLLPICCIVRRSSARFPVYSCPSCLRPVPQSCNGSIVSIALPQNFKTSSAMNCTDGNICNANRTLRAMIWCGLSTIWIRCVAASPFAILSSSQRRLSIFSIPPAPPPESVYLNSETYAALG